jgi:outer membrane protein TolC
MNRGLHRPRPGTLAVLVSLLLLSGCASVDFDQSLATTNQEAANFTQGHLALGRTAPQRADQDATARQLLLEPISQVNAVQLALSNSPALQAMLAQNWGDAANAAQTGRIANPVFSFERMVAGDELEFGRLLSFGLLDLLTLPQRHGVARRSIERAQLQLTADVVDQVTQVRQAWVKAVAAQQTLGYAAQVFEAAQVSAELARRMQSVGNFSRLQRLRQQAFYADAATQLAGAQHQATAGREALVRLLGLTDAQAAQLKLPERLPDLPREPRSPQDVGQSGSAGRLDIRLAQSAYEAAAQAQGLGAVTSLIDVELGVIGKTVFDRAHGDRTTGSGYEISVKLPVFDSGQMRRDAMNAQTLAAANRLEATARAAGSNLRESYSAYRTAFDVARHYRDEIVPLRKLMAEENLLRYNGMLIGVFELLSDTREQVGSVMAAIAAEQQFWLADAALQATQMGKPTRSAIGAVAFSAAGGGDAGH